MLPPESSSAPLISRIREGRAKADSNFLQELLTECNRHKPDGYDDHHKTLSCYFDGNQADATAALLSSRYPTTGSDMMAITLNVTRASAELDAQTYRDAPRRWLEIDGKEVQPKADGGAPQRRAAKAAKLWELSRLDHFLSNIEPLVSVHKVMFVRVGYPRSDFERAGKTPRFVFTPFAPQHVHLIPHPGALAGELWAAEAILLNQGHPKDKHNTYELWTRNPEGQVVSMLVSDKPGEMFGPETVHRSLSHYPIVAINDGESMGHLLQDQERDIVAMQEQVNISLSNWFFKDETQGHPLIYAVGDNNPEEGTDIAWGPGMMRTWTDPNVRVGILSSNHDKVTLDGLHDYMRMYGTSKRQSVNAWAKEPGPPQSGVSRIVQDLHANQKRKERGASYTKMEEENLLPLLIEIADEMAGDELGQGPKIGGKDARPRVMMSEPEIYTEPAQQTQIAISLYEAGLISGAKAAVMADVFATEKEAVASGLSDKIEKKEAPVDQLSQQQQPGLQGGQQPGRLEEPLGPGRQAGAQVGGQESGPAKR